MPVAFNLASHRNSPARSTKSTTSHAYGALSACKLTVSGSISLPSRGSFHLSLTVLFAIGHMVVFSLMGWSPHIPSEFLVFRRTRCILLSYPFAYEPVTLFGIPFQISSANVSSSYDTRGIFLSLLRALPFSLATTRGIVFTFFSSGY